MGMAARRRRSNATGPRLVFLDAAVQRADVLAARHRGGHCEMGALHGDAAVRCADDLTDGVTADCLRWLVCTSRRHGRYSRSVRRDDPV